MQICLVCRGTVRDFLKGYQEEQNDVYVFGFAGLGTVSYEQELQGKTRLLEDVAVLSKKSNSIVVSGCMTDTCSQRRKSALIAENGRILGVSDCVHAIDEKFSCGAALRVYETKKGRIGIAVAEDLRFPKVMQTLVECGSDLIICPFEKMEDTMPAVLARAYAYAFGTPILFCAEGYALIMTETGEAKIASPMSPLYSSLQLKAEYHLIQTRKKGIRK